MFKKVVIATLVAGILGVGGVAVDLQDLTKGKEKITRNGVDFWIEPNSPVKQEILSGEFDNVVEKIKDERKNEQRQTRSVNPQLSSVHIYEVKSTQGGTEEIIRGQGSTQKDHGGSLFKVRTRVMGFGCISDTAVYNNQAVKESYFMFVDTNGDNTADGCISERDLSGKASSGSFVFTARNSSGNPYKVLTSSLYIK